MMRHSESLKPPVENASDLWRRQEVVLGEEPAPASLTLMQRSRTQGDARRMTEFLRIDRGREA